MTGFTHGRRGEYPRRHPRAGPSRGLGRRGGERGAVTAELAAALPVLAIVLVTTVWVVAAATAQLRCSDAAREAARALARGDDVAVGEAVAGRIAPEGARVAVRDEGGLVMVEVETQVRVPSPLAVTFPGITVRGRAAALGE